MEPINSNKKLIIFDLDGTLAESKAELDQEMAELLMDLLRKFKVAVISGGKYAQFEKQLVRTLKNARNFDEKLLHKFYLFPTCSTVFYRFENGWKQVYAEELSLEERKKIFDGFESAFKEGVYEKPEETFGELIEDRRTQIAFSALGQRAPTELKKKWDPDAKKRKEIIKVLMKFIPEFEIRVGGATTIDVTRKGIDKSYGIKKIKEILGIDIPDMLFIGDGLFEGGNDYPVKAAGVECIAISGPDETKEIIKRLLSQ